MPYAFPYPYALVLRSRNSSGVVQANFFGGSWYYGASGAPSANTAALVPGVWAPYTCIAPTVLGPPTYEKVELPREGLDWSNDPITVGFRPKLHVEWTQLGTFEIYGLYNDQLPPLGSPLRVVLSALTTLGSFLEVALDGWLSSPNFRAVNLVSGIDYENIDGKDLGIKLSLDFEGKALIQSVPPVDAASWGSAT